MDRPSSTFPNFAGKHAEASMFTPQDFLDFMRERRPGAENAALPENVIMCYQSSLMRHTSGLPGTTESFNPAAGTLHREIEPGGVMLCTKAVRDEGVSHHYLTPEEYSYPDEALTELLRTSFRDRGIPFVEGAAWTIDAPYRETVAEARHYQERGVIAVEMEAAALFAVAKYREVAIATAFVSSDSLAEMTWTPSHGTPEVVTALRTLFDAAVDALQRAS